AQRPHGELARHLAEAHHHDPPRLARRRLPRRLPPPRRRSGGESGAVKAAGYRDIGERPFAAGICFFIPSAPSPPEDPAVGGGSKLSTMRKCISQWFQSVPGIARFI